MKTGRIFLALTLILVGVSIAYAVDSILETLALRNAESSYSRSLDLVKEAKSTLLKRESELIDSFCELGRIKVEVKKPFDFKDSIDKYKKNCIDTLGSKKKAA